MNKPTQAQKDLALCEESRRILEQAYEQNKEWHKAAFEFATRFGATI